MLGAVGPAWTRGEAEAPAGQRDMGGWQAAVYDAEQQQRLGVDEFGAPANATGPADAGGFREQFTVVEPGKADVAEDDRAAMARELAAVRSEVAELRAELGLAPSAPAPAPPVAPAAPQPAPIGVLPRTMSDEERQVQAALALSGHSSDRTHEPTRLPIMRQVSGYDGMRTVSPVSQPKKSRPANVGSLPSEPEPEPEPAPDEEDWGAPLTRQISGRGGMRVRK